MAYYITVAGGTVYKITTAGVATALTLPTGITIDTTRPARMAILNEKVVIVNAPNRSIWVDRIGTIRPLGLTAPASPVVVSGTGSGTLSGTYKVRYTFKVYDPDTHALLQESPMSPLSNATTITSQLLLASGVGISPDTISARGMYRTVTGGSAIVFPWADLEGNIVTSYADDISDSNLSLTPAPDELGNPPGSQVGTYMTLITEWKGFLWGVGDKDPDTIRRSASGLIYAWPFAGAYNIEPVRADQYGITGLISRRDELGICKRNIIWKMVGSDPDTFELVKVRDSKGRGCYAPDSVVVVDNVGYFLGGDGVYTWGADGVDSISDVKVRNWFASDTYFNRAQYPNAFAKYNSRYHGYELHLAAAGSTNIDRWVFYDIARKTWWGPHLTDAFTPTMAGEIIDANGIVIPVIGSSVGHIWQQNQAGFIEGVHDIPLDLISAFHNSATPDMEKLWGRLSLISKIETNAGNMAIAVKTGGLDATSTYSLAPDLRKGREKFRILGPGRMLNLQITETTASQGCELYGYEVSPVHELGRR
jgi:hypothetical protein